MKFEELTQDYQNNVKKYIKEELLTNQKVKLPINPNEFNYSLNGGLHIHGRLKDMDNNQIKSKVIKNIMKT
jgi:hypothetical protein